MLYLDAPSTDATAIDTITTVTHLAPRSQINPTRVHISRARYNYQNSISSCALSIGLTPTDILLTVGIRVVVRHAKSSNRHGKQGRGECQWYGMHFDTFRTQYSREVTSDPVADVVDLNSGPGRAFQQCLWFLPGCSSILSRWPRLGHLASLLRWLRREKDRHLYPISLRV